MFKYVKSNKIIKKTYARVVNCKSNTNMEDHKFDCLYLRFKILLYLSMNAILDRLFSTKTITQEGMQTLDGIACE